MDHLIQSNANEEIVHLPCCPHAGVAPTGDVVSHPVRRAVQPLAIDLDSHMVKIEVNGAAQPLPLTLTEFRLLAHMARTPTKAFTRSELVDACLPGSDALERTVDSHISNLRKKLGEAGAPGMLSGVRGIGYRLAAL